MRVRDKLYEVAVEKSLRRSTVLSYARLLNYIDILDRDVDDAVIGLAERLWMIQNVNTRRAAAIACRSVLGVTIKVPKSIPRKYTLPEEDTLRLALMTSPHEIRGLVMMYAGLRIGEACAVTENSFNGDNLRVDKQIQQLFETGKPTTANLAPVKTEADDVIVPSWLPERFRGIQETANPNSVRESLRRAGKKVGITLNPHLLRHWYATTLLERGVPIQVVSKQMRHSDVATTLRTYAQHDAGKHIRDIWG